MAVLGLRMLALLLAGVQLLSVWAAPAFASPCVGPRTGKLTPELLRHRCHDGGHDDRRYWWPRGDAASADQQARALDPRQRDTVLRFVDRARPAPRVTAGVEKAGAVRPPAASVQLPERSVGLPSWVVSGAGAVSTVVGAWLATSGFGAMMESERVPAENQTQVDLWHASRAQQRVGSSLMAAGLASSLASGVIRGEGATGASVAIATAGTSSLVAGVVGWLGARRFNAVLERPHSTDAIYALNRERVERLATIGGAAAGAGLVAVVGGVLLWRNTGRPESASVRFGASQDGITLAGTW